VAQAQISKKKSSHKKKHHHHKKHRGSSSDSSSSSESDNEKKTKSEAKPNAVKDFIKEFGGAKKTEVKKDAPKDNNKL